MTTNNDFCDKNKEKPNDYVKKPHNEQDLTEQWKKGELKTGWYYVKNEFGNIFISDYSEDYDYIGDKVVKDFFTEVSDITEVLAPVPSYEQWQQMKAFCEEFNALEVAEENQKLKELLKECIDGLEKIKHIGETKNLGAVYQVAERTLAKIDEVLK